MRQDVNNLGILLLPIGRYKRMFLNYRSTVSPAPLKYFDSGRTGGVSDVIRFCMFMPQSAGQGGRAVMIWALALLCYLF